MELSRRGASSGHPSHMRGWEEMGDAGEQGQSLARMETGPHAGPKAGGKGCGHWGLGLECTGRHWVDWDVMGCTGKHWEALSAVGVGLGPGSGSIFGTGGPRLGSGSGSQAGGVGPSLGSGCWTGVWVPGWCLGPMWWSRFPDGVQLGSWAEVWVLG